MSKGSHRRPEDTEAYRSNFDRVFGPKPTNENIDPEFLRAFAEDVREAFGPRCRLPSECTGSCVRDPACNE